MGQIPQLKTAAIKRPMMRQAMPRNGIAVTISTLPVIHTISAITVAPIQQFFDPHVS
jgi:hypothetical protein